MHEEGGGREWGDVVYQFNAAWVEYRRMMCQRVLEDCLERIGKVKPGVVLSPIHGAPWHYRRRARLGVRLVRKKGGVLVGFHEKRSSFVADMQSCEVLPEPVGKGLRSGRERLRPSLCAACPGQKASLFLCGQIEQ